MSRGRGPAGAEGRIERAPSALRPRTRLLAAQLARTPLRRLLRRRAAGRAAAAEDARRGDRPAAPARPGQAAARRLRVGPAALDDPVGPARRRQDDAGAPDGRRLRRPVHRHVGGARRRQGHPRGGRAGARGAARRAARTVVFVDEVHRFNKSQQDAFLPHVESGLFTFIGATTENPSFEVNSALLSRATVHVLKPLERRRPRRVLLERAQALLAAPPLTEAGARPPDRLCRRRRAAPAQRLREPGRARPATRRADRRGACSSRRSASSCAATTRAASSSTTPSRRCTRRCAAATRTPRCTGSCACSTAASTRATRRAALVRMASEDIGLADPRALRLALDAAEIYERLGSPEGELALAEAVVYLAMAPKTNAVYTAYNAARAFVKSDGTRPVPLHLRNAPTALMKDARLRQGLSLRPRRGRRLRRRRDATGPTTCRAAALLRAGATRPRDPHRRAPGRAARPERRGGQERSRAPSEPAGDTE